MKKDTLAFVGTLVIALGLIFILSEGLARGSAPFSLGSEPADKAEEAFYIQSGISKSVTQFQSYMVDSYAKPLYLDKLVVPYWVYRRRELTVPIFGVDRVNIKPNSLTFSIPMDGIK